MTMTRFDLPAAEPRAWAQYPGADPAPPRTLVDVFTATVARHPRAVAIEDVDERLTYRQVLQRARRVAGDLAVAGVRGGDRVGVRVPSGSSDLYVAILGVLFAGAAYVPVDAEDPDERAAAVWDGAAVSACVGAGLAVTARRTGAPGPVATAPPRPADDAWVIFTSGSTGAPKGVAVSHRSAAAFVDAEAGLFRRDAPLGPGDRVLAGLSVAFDASCEEMWLAWRTGACLVPAPRSLVRSGVDLAAWLVLRRITVVSTVPTLAMLWPDADLAGVRLLILGGEACPAELAERLCAPGREVWNTYGPTEATVVSSAALLTPDGPVRIGLPLQGWELAVVDPDGVPVGWGESGELVIGGVGLGHYLDGELDAQRFRALPALGWDRAYRSGDVVLADPEGLRFTGRADDQVKVAGRRIELGEIDAALLALDGVGAAAAAVRRTPAGTDVLVGYLVGVAGRGPDQDLGLDLDAARAQLLDRLPAALVPVLCELPELPTRTSGKVDRAALPWPLPSPPGAASGSTSGSTSGSADAAFATDAERALAALWHDLLGPAPLAPTTDFFAAGGTSIAAARLVSELRRTYPGASVADVYRHPTLQAMAEQLDAQVSGPVTARARARTPRWTWAAQLGVQLLLLTYRGLQWLLLVVALDSLFGPARWGTTASIPTLIVLWLLLFSSPARLIGGTALIRALMRGVRPGEHRRGGGTHLRVWTCERVAATCGLLSFVGSPAALTLARRLGNTAGDGARFDTLPPLTGLGTFGAGASMEGEADVQGYWLDGDRFVVGVVEVGAGARIGARSTLLPGAVVGADAEIEPGSSVQGVVPAGDCWAGAPAVRVGPAGVGWPESRTVSGNRWRFAYGAALFARAAVTLGIVALCLAVIGPRFGDDDTVSAAFHDLLSAAPLAVVLSVGTYMLAIVLTVRLASRAITPGYHHDDGRAAFCSWLVHVVTGDARRTLYPLYASLLTPAWLRLLGAHVGTNTEASTVVGLPNLTHVGDDAFLADDALLAPPRLRGGWMHLGPATIGDSAFVGNSAIVGVDRRVPSGGLIGVLSTAPSHSEPGTSWLGQPAIEIPRVATAVDERRTLRPARRLVLARAGVETLRLLPMIVSLQLVIVGSMTISWVDARAGLAAAALTSGVVLFVLGLLAAAVSVVAKWLLVGRVTTSEHPLWSSFVWRNELADTFAESLAVPWLLDMSCGTPLLNWWLRAMGASIGRDVWCDTWWLPEQDLVRLGDGVAVNRGSVVQTHLFHDRLMRLDVVELGAGATVGPHGVVLPGGRLGAHATTAPASLVMRDESVPAHTRWSGNPISAWQQQ